MGYMNRAELSSKTEERFKLLTVKLDNENFMSNIIDISSHSVTSKLTEILYFFGEECL